MPEFDTEAREGREGINDEAAPITGVVITLLRIGSGLNRTFDADRVGHSFILAQV